MNCLPAFNGPTKKIVLLPAAIFMVDLILGGPLGLIQTIPFRHLLFFMTFISLLIYITLYRKWTIKGWFVFPLSFIIIFTFFNLLWGVPFSLFTSVDEANAIRESQPYAFLLLLPLLLLCIQDDPNALRTINRFVIVLSSILAMFQVSIWIVGSFVPGMGLPVVLTVRAILSNQSMFVGLMPDGFYRVFWISSLWTFVALFLVPFSIRSKRVRLLLYGLFLMDIFVSYSRGIWVGAIVGIVIAWLLHSRLTARSMRNGFLFLALVIFLSIPAFFLTFNFSDNRLASTFSKEDKSIAERLYQFDSLMKGWEKHAFIGTGYGASAPGYIRSESAPYSYELVPVAMLMKLGIIGFLLYWGAWLSMIAYAFILRRRFRLRSACFTGGLCGYAIVVCTNPMLTNFIGIAILSLFFIQWIYFFKPSNTNALQDACVER